VYEDGEKTVTLKGDRIAEEFQQLVEAYVQRTYGGATVPATGPTTRSLRDGVIPLKVLS
jgi:hypothetical protein